MKVDLTVLAIPAYVGAIGAEYAWQRRHPVPPGTRAGDYQLADTLASLAMGVGSLVAPFVATAARPRHARAGPVREGADGRRRRAGLATTVADVVAGGCATAGCRTPATVPPRVREVQEELAELRSRRPPYRPADGRRTRRLPRSQGARRPRRGAVAATALTVATTWAAQTAASGSSAAAGSTSAPAWPPTRSPILGWDFIYYWNHRFNHESRWLWAVHVAHHSSERYNLSTALRQPVAEG